MKHGGTRPGAGRPKGKGPHGEATKPMRLPVSMIPEVVRFVQHKGYKLQLYGSKIQAGFPSPADDHIECAIDLNEHLIKNPAETFLVRVAGQSMINARIHENDILIVDRSITAKHGKIVIAAVDGQLTVKRLQIAADGKIILQAENPKFAPIVIQEGSEIFIWGVVTNIIHTLC
jgi:DNA polymerase V